MDGMVLESPLLQAPVCTLWCLIEMKWWIIKYWGKYLTSWLWFSIQVMYTPLYSSTLGFSGFFFVCLFECFFYLNNFQLHFALKHFSNSCSYFQIKTIFILCETLTDRESSNIDTFQAWTLRHYRNITPCKQLWQVTSLSV